jgi:CASK-interacting protein
MPLSPMAAVPAPAPEPQPGSSFTQIFRAVEGTVPAPATVRSPQSWDQVPQSQGRVVPPPFNPIPLTPDPRPSDASNLTQLLRTLDPGSAPEPQSPPPPSRPDAFTSLYGERQPIAPPVERMQSTLATPNFNQPPGTEFAAPPRNTPPDPAPASGGASDFTRIIQASSLREQALRLGEQPIEAAKQATPPPPPPPQSQMPGYPPVAGQFPHPNVLPPLNFGHGGPVQPAQSFKPAAPNLAPPQWMPPEPPPLLATPAAKTPQFLPLVLIGIIFVLIVVLVAVIFLLKR